MRRNIPRTLVAPLLLALLSFSPATSVAGVGTPPARAEGKAEITVLYDAFGKTSTMKKDWGFSALIEYGGKGVLFDTGNNAEIFAHNGQAKGVDLTQLDFAVISHRHGDHTSGLNHLIKVNPGVKIYAPQEAFGVFGATLPGTFYRRDEFARRDALLRRQGARDAALRHALAGRKFHLGRQDDGGRPCSI